MKKDGHCTIMAIGTYPKTMLYSNPSENADPHLVKRLTGGGHMEKYNKDLI